MTDVSLEPKEFDFDSLADEEKALLVALPYRVGYWVSQVDTVGGIQSSAAEISALECLITSYAEDMCKSEFVQRLMEMTVEGKERWPLWQQDIDRVPEECGKACILLADRIGDKDLGGFQENLFEIGLAVARVYREEADARRGGLLTRMGSALLDSLRRYPNVEDDVFGSANISGRERAALMRLREALGM